METTPSSETFHLTPHKYLMSHGLALIIQYLNTGMTPRDLASIKHAAQLWCTTYTHETGFSLVSWTAADENRSRSRSRFGFGFGSGSGYRSRLPEPVCAAHPAFWDLCRLSWERLRGGGPEQQSGHTSSVTTDYTSTDYTFSGDMDTDADTDIDVIMDMLVAPPNSPVQRPRDPDTDIVMGSSGSGSGSGCCAARSDKMRLPDEEIYHLVDVLDREWPAKMAREGWRDAYAAWRAPLRPGDLKASPIIFFIPDTVAALAELDPDEGVDPWHEREGRIRADEVMTGCCDMDMTGGSTVGQEQLVAMFSRLSGH
ncbi:hypothetical protein E4U54_006196 [Claviceps lovelessii]|nr:hypothetical protein E4U54_006196 [Claviceps lovelessii]